MHEKGGGGGEEKNGWPTEGRGLDSCELHAARSASKLHSSTDSTPYSCRDVVLRHVQTRSCVDRAVLLVASAPPLVCEYQYGLQQ